MLFVQLVITHIIKIQIFTILVIHFFLILVHQMTMLLLQPSMLLPQPGLPVPILSPNLHKGWSTSVEHVRVP